MSIFTVDCKELSNNEKDETDTDGKIYQQINSTLKQDDWSRRNKEIHVLNYLHNIAVGKAITMSALPAPVVGDLGPEYKIPKVQCILIPDASDSLTTKRLDTTTPNDKGT